MMKSFLLNAISPIYIQGEENFVVKLRAPIVGIKTSRKRQQAYSPNGIPIK